MKKNKWFLLFALIIVFLEFSTTKAQTKLLYGMTEDGGAADGGIIFYYDSVLAKDSIVYSFPAGAFPDGSLIQATDGNLYGMTSYGGKWNKGNIFRYNPITSVFDTLVSFSGVNGYFPNGSLVQATDGNLYGMTAYGGSSFGGNIFQYNITTKVLTSLVSFTGTNGALPYGNLIQGNNGFLYGMTYQGGSSNKGTLFKCTTLGTLTTLVNFTGTNGEYPYGSLIQALDKNFYGMTYQGGTLSDGTLFKCDTNGTLTVLVNFAGASNGEQPYGNLLQASDSNLYGMTSHGGTLNQGNLFRYSIAPNSLTTLVNFNGLNGEYSESSLIQASDGLLYGMTLDGPTYGTAFKCTTTGTLTTLIKFDSTNGKYPIYTNFLEVSGVPTAVNNIIEGNSLALYPNPANQTLNLSFQRNTNGATVKIEIVDITGRAVLSTNTTMDNNKVVQIDIGGLVQGIYFVKVLTDKESKVSKFIKQ